MSFHRRCCCSSSGPGLGACCFPNGSCQQTTFLGCNQLGGQFINFGVPCVPNPCPQPTFGACCEVDVVGEQLVCTNRTEADCSSVGGEWLGADTECVGSIPGEPCTCYDCLLQNPCPTYSVQFFYEGGNAAGPLCNSSFTCTLVQGPGSAGWSIGADCTGLPCCVDAGAPLCPNIIPTHLSVNCRLTTGPDSCGDPFDPAPFFRFAVVLDCHYLSGGLCLTSSRSFYWHAPYGPECPGCLPLGAWAECSDPNEFSSASMTLL